MVIKKRKKRTLTLIEMMIVILLITLVTGVVGYNMKGALDRGKAFRTEAAQNQLRELLILRAAETGQSLERLLSFSKEGLKKELDGVGLAKDTASLLKDGWGEDFELRLTRDRRDVQILSKRLDRYYQSHSKVAVDRHEEEE